MLPTTVGSRPRRRRCRTRASADQVKVPASACPRNGLLHRFERLRAGIRALGTISADLGLTSPTTTPPTALATGPAQRGEIGEASPPAAWATTRSRKDPGREGAKARPDGPFTVYTSENSRSGGPSKASPPPGAPSRAPGPLPQPGVPNAGACPCRLKCGHQKRFGATRALTPCRSTSSPGEVHADRGPRTAPVSRP